MSGCVQTFDWYCVTPTLSSVFANEKQEGPGFIRSEQDGSTLIHITELHPKKL